MTRSTPTVRSNETPSATHWLTLVGVTAVYVFTALLGLQLQPLSGFASLVWAPTGIALAALLIGGWRMWPAVAAGAWLANTLHGAGPLAAAGIAAGNTLEATAAVWLLGRAGFDRSLARVRDVVALIALAAVVATLISATLGVASLYAAGQVTQATYGPTWFAWWLGDMLGALTVAPLCLVWSAWPSLGRPARVFEGLVLTVATVAATLIVFEFWRVDWLVTFPKTYLLFPLQLWAALRFGPHGVVAVSFAVAALAIAITARGVGPFAGIDLAAALFHLQSYLAVLATTGLVIAAVETERRRVGLEQDRAQERLEEQIGRRTRALRDTIDELRLTQSRLEDAQRIASVGSWEWDIRTDRVTWSDELLRVYGLRRDECELSYAAFLAQVHPDDRAHADQHLRQAQRSQQEFEFEHRIVRPDGAHRTLLARGKVVHDDAGAAARLFGTGQDITEAKQAEHALRRAYEEMDQRVRERTVEVTAANAALHRENAERRHLEDELRQKLEQLAENDRRKDEFLVMLAHELRNPLAAVAAALGVLSTPEPTSAQPRRALAVAQRQLRNLAAMVDDLLDVARLTRGRIVLRRRSVSLHDAIQTAVDAARPEIEARRHRLRVTHAPPQTAIDADPTRCEQILLNLLNNAAKYTPPGGQLEVEASVDGSQAVIRVRDNGIGMDPQLLDRVFELFVQADRSLDRQHGGLGIGLTMVRRLVELHGGSVIARSDGPGLGSEFEVRMPLAAELPSPEPSEAQPPQPHVPSLVLLVDDNRDVTRAMQLLLQGWGHRVVVAHDAEQALALVHSECPRIVLLDIGLPGISGYEVARRIRAGEDAGDRIVLIAITGYGREEDRREALAAGFDAHLLKPFEPSRLSALLNTLGARSGDTRA